MNFLARLIWTFALFVPIWLADGAAPAAAAEILAIVKGKVPAADKLPERVSFLLLDANGQPDTTKAAVLCDVADVQKTVARPLEGGDQVTFIDVPGPASPSCRLAVRSSVS